MGAYSFGIRKIGTDHYRLYWTVDHHYRTSRLRHPRGHSRDTDEAGMRRFSKKHRLEMLADEPATPQPNVDEGDGK